MARLPSVGGDDGNWGTILNQFLSVSHNADGTLQNSVLASSPLGAKRIYVDQYGADPTGATDSTAAFVAAQNAGGSGAYVLVLSVGTYVLGTSSDINTFGAQQGMIGQGSAHTKITYKGNGTG